MKNSKQLNKLNPLVIKAFVSGVLVVLPTAFALISMNILPADPTIEILATMVTFGLIMVSLHYVYQEHLASYAEKKLAVDLINRIQADCTRPLNKRMISSKVQNLINTQPSHLLRIQVLEHYKKDRLALDQLCQSFSSDDNYQFHINSHKDWQLGWRTMEPVKVRVSR